jgi:hypothetical protein
VTALDADLLPATVISMRDHNRKQESGFTSRVTYSPITKEALQNGFFHAFDLLGLDEELLSPRLRKRLRGILCKPKGDKPE